MKESIGIHSASWPWAFGSHKKTNGVEVLFSAHAQRALAGSVVTKARVRAFGFGGMSRTAMVVQTGG